MANDAVHDGAHICGGRNDELVLPGFAMWTLKHG